jgi:hypothetical protein
MPALPPAIPLVPADPALPAMSLPPPPASLLGIPLPAIGIIAGVPATPPAGGGTVIIIPPAPADGGTSEPPTAAPMAGCCICSLSSSLVHATHHAEHAHATPIASAPRNCDIVTSTTVHMPDARVGSIHRDMYPTCIRRTRAQVKTRKLRGTVQG